MRLRIRWLGNSCIEIKNKRHILIDPNFIAEPEGVADVILITHEHDDHFSPKAINYGRKIYAPKPTIKVFNIQAKEVKEGMRIENILVTKSFCWKSEYSVGYLIEDEFKILHLGDSFKSMGIETDLIFTPIFKEYHDQILDMIKICHAKCAIPIHFDYFRAEKKELAEKLVEKIRLMGVGSRILVPGKWIQVKELLEK